MADYIAAEALDSEGEPIEPNQPKKSRVVHHAKRSRKPRAKKLKPDAGVESDDQDDDFTAVSSDSESGGGSTDIEAVSNAEVRCLRFYLLFHSLKVVSLHLSFPQRLSQRRATDLERKNERVPPQRSLKLRMRIVHVEFPNALQVQTMKTLF